MSANLVWGTIVPAAIMVNQTAMEQHNRRCLTHLFSGSNQVEFNKIFTYANEVVATTDRTVFEALSQIPGRYVALCDSAGRILELEYILSEAESLVFERAEELAYFQSCLVHDRWKKEAAVGQSPEYYSNIVNLDALIRFSSNRDFVAAKTAARIVPNGDYRFTTLVRGYEEKGRTQQELIEDTARLLAENHIQLNEAWFCTPRTRVRGEEIKQLHDIMKGVAEYSPQNTALENIVQRPVVNAQLHFTAAAGNGDCLFHSYTANILYAVSKETPAPDFLRGLSQNLLPYMRRQAEKLGIMLLHSNDIQVIFQALLNAYPVQNKRIATFNFAALSHQLMVPALRQMLYEKRNESDVKAIALPLLREAIDHSDVNDFAPAFQDFLRQGHRLSDNALYAAYWQHHNAMGIYASPIEQKMMDHLLGVTSHFVQTHNLALSETPVERNKANFYIRKTAAHFDAYLGVHPQHGTLQQKDADFARKLSLEFSRTHSQPQNSSEVGFSPLKDIRPKTTAVPIPTQQNRLSSTRKESKHHRVVSEPIAIPKVKPMPQKAEMVVTDFFKTLSAQDLRVEKQEQIIETIRQGRLSPQLPQAKQEVTALIAKHEAEVTRALKNRLDTLGKKRDGALTLTEKKELEQGDEKIARLEQLKEIKMYLESTSRTRPRR